MRYPASVASSSISAWYFLIAVLSLSTSASLMTAIVASSFSFRPPFSISRLASGLGSKTCGKDDAIGIGGLSRSSAIRGFLSARSPIDISRLLLLLLLLFRESLRISLARALVPPSSSSPSPSLPSVSPKWKSLLLPCLLTPRPERTARSGLAATHPAFPEVELDVIYLADSPNRERLGGNDFPRFSLSPSARWASCFGVRPRGSVDSVTVVEDAREEDDGTGRAQEGEHE